MPGRLTRRQFAWEHTYFGTRDFLLAAFAWGIYLWGWQRYDWGPEVRPDVWAFLSACLAIILLWVLEFGVNFTRAHIVQDRADLATFRRENQVLKGKADLGHASPPPGTAINPPLSMKPTGYYSYKIQKEEREEFERLKVENAELRRRLGL